MVKLHPVLEEIHRNLSDKDWHALKESVREVKYVGACYSAGDLRVFVGDRLSIPFRKAAKKCGSVPTNSDWHEWTHTILKEISNERTS